MLKLWVFLLWAYATYAIPFYDDFVSDVKDVEFIPIEEQRSGRQDGQLTLSQLPVSRSNLNPFAVGALTTDVKSPKPSEIFLQSFPFFSGEFLTTLEGFVVGSNLESWWKGQNVCTKKEESENATDETDVGEVSDTFHFTVNSCDVKPNKYVCTKIVNQNGNKKTLTLTRQCCYGYGRPNNAQLTTPCEKIKINDIETTAQLMGAKQFIESGKYSGDLGEMLRKDKPLTLFIPNDAAFQEYRDQHHEENNVGRAQTSIFKLHSVLDDVQLENILSEKLLNSAQANQKIRINAYQLPHSLGTEYYRYSANCVPIGSHDRLSKQAVLHTLTGVLKPLTKTVMDIIRERVDISIMRNVLEKTNMSALLETDQPVTIFVPTNEAFKKLEPHLRRALMKGLGCASNILKNHMLDFTFCSLAMVPGGNTTTYNLLGEPLLLNRKQRVLNQTEIDSININNAAKILDIDIMGTNGVLHVIDTVLPTASALPMTSLMLEKNLTIFKRLIEASGFDDELDDLYNVTVFAPTDSALQHSVWSQLLYEEPEHLKDNKDLWEFLNYHVIKPMIKTCDLSESSLPTMAGTNVRLNLYSTHGLFSDVFNRATVNCARLVYFDADSCGSVLHQIDRPLSPPKNNLLQTLESNTNFSKFLELVRKANLTHLLSNNLQSLTLLVPKNDAFEEFSESAESKTFIQSTEEIEAQVKMHIVNDVVCCAGIIPTKWPFVRSIESISGERLRITRDRRPKIENAGVTKCDIVATNGILHEINDIIVPSSSAQTLTRSRHGDFEVYF
ncbi:mfas [Drosophila busckii]|uniref:Mfas n=1 Tax=Drosophila busckii TaxID=30019 RepID=A0A0M4EPA9_DROBS|nr:transforming growth factor-beta-induced protein ig-h3 [Drosophila busckii]ALC45910.1 mfas [Drosophila busckii]